MGNRDNQGRFAGTQGQAIRRAPRLSPMEQQMDRQMQTTGPGHADACAVNMAKENTDYKPSQTEIAEKALYAAREHDKQASAAQLQLHAQMPFFGPALDQQAEALFKWFAHQGFWPAGWAPHEQFFDPPEEDSPSAEYRRMKKSEKLALIHSEVSECLEAVRNNDTYNEAEELADALVRLLDYAGGFGIDLSNAFYRKMLVNYERPHRHSKKF